MWAGALLPVSAATTVVTKLPGSVYVSVAVEVMDDHRVRDGECGIVAAREIECNGWNSARLTVCGYRNGWVAADTRDRGASWTEQPRSRIGRSATNPRRCEGSRSSSGTCASRWSRSSSER